MTHDNFFIIPNYNFYIGNLEKSFQLRFDILIALIKAYNINLKYVKANAATYTDLLSFHSSDYIYILKEKSSNQDQLIQPDVDYYGLSYDCSLSKSSYDYSLDVVGSSIMCANIANHFLFNQKNAISLSSPTIINFYGGWHHAKRSTASGFCFANDIVICINHLKRYYKQVIYIDLDLHHCDGVEEAFLDCDKEETIHLISFHHHSPGFFPGTGGLRPLISTEKHVNYKEASPIPTKRFTVNIPLKEGIGNAHYLNAFKRVLDIMYGCSQTTTTLKNIMDPCAIIIQCGADGLVTDPHKIFNLTPECYVDCINYVKLMICAKLTCCPLIILGGGGYNFSETAKCWTQLTASLCQQQLNDDIPEHKYFPIYGPSYELSISPGLQKDQNTTKYIKDVLDAIEEQIKI